MHWVVGLLASLGSAVAVAQAPLDKAAFINQLMGKMTVAEKVGQLDIVYLDPVAPDARVREHLAGGLIGGVAVVPPAPYGHALQQMAVERSRLKIPLFFSTDVIHGLHTVFPVSLALAASWDMQALALMGRISAQEASADGVHLTYGPMLDISRDPRWGRVSEGYGEDPYLVSRIARVLINAYQGGNFRAAGSIMAGVKHVALYGAVEGGKDYNSVDMSRAQMYQYYFPPYRAAVEAGAQVAMLAFNTINGVPSTANPWLIKDVLRHEWGFAGVTLSDSNAVTGLITHGVAIDQRHAASLAILSGLDMELSDDAYVRQLPALVKSGAVSVAVLDEAVRRVLGMKYEMGLFEDPYRNLSRLPPEPIERRLQRAAARDVARRTLVLLKNRQHTLPLSKHGRIALVGPLANSRRDLLGSYCGDCAAQRVVSIREGMTRAVEGKATLLYAKGANVTDDRALSDRLARYSSPLDLDPRSPEALLEEAMAVARQADVIVAVVGEAWNFSDEAISRTRLDLEDSQQRLLSALRTLGKTLVVVLVNGRPLTLTQVQGQADALLETWFSGMEGGNAVADVLFGGYNPSGKLPMTFPRSVGQVPIYYNHLNTGHPFIPDQPNKYMSQYIDEQEGPLFPFGFGLSYTRFALSDLQLSSAVLHRGQSLRVGVTLANAGERDGETVVQLYIRDPVASVSRPVKELKGFQKVMLKAGERRRIEFTVGEDDLKFYDVHLRHVAEPGEFRLQIGLDSREVIEQRFELR